MIVVIKESSFTKQKNLEVEVRKMKIKRILKEGSMGRYKGPLKILNEIRDSMAGYTATLVVDGWEVAGTHQKRMDGWTDGRTAQQMKKTHPNRKKINERTDPSMNQPHERGRI